MSQVEQQPEEQFEDQPEEQIEIVPGTEGTEYEGKTEEEIERLEYEKIRGQVAEGKDPDIPDTEEAQAEETGEPTDEPVEEKPEEPTEEAKEDEEPKEPTGFEWLDELPEEHQQSAKDYIERMGQNVARYEQRVNSHLGQLRPAQRIISKQTQRIRELESQLTKQQPSPINIEDRKKDYNARIDEEYKEFPEEAAKLKKLYSDSLDGLPEVLETPSPVVQSTPIATPDLNDEIQHLATAYSDWGERRFSPEFNEWISRQSPDVTQLINSPFASDNVALLDAFTRDNPDWLPPQKPEDFHSLRQAQHSPLFRGWAEGEGVNPDMNVSQLPDYQRDSLLTRFKSDMSAVLSEEEQAAQKVTKLTNRRKEQLQDRNPGTQRSGIKPGQKIDLNTRAGQIAYYKQLKASGQLG